jgi:hypothetical protein
MPNPIRHGARKRQREMDAAARRQAKVEKRRRPAQEGDVDPIGSAGPEARFPSAFPAAPPAFDGIARTLSRGL